MQETRPFDDAFFTKLRVFGSQSEEDEALIDIAASKTHLYEDYRYSLGLSPDDTQTATCIHDDSRSTPVFRAEIEFNGRRRLVRLFALP